MTWWYRWLCRLSGVLGAVCEYPARGRGRPPASHRACAPASPLPHAPTDWTRVGPGAPARLLWLRACAWAPRSGAGLAAPGDVPGGNTNSRGGAGPVCHCVCAPLAERTVRHLLRASRGVPGAAGKERPARPEAA